ncbi:MAG: hypothetical protein NTW10_03270 [Bacteroidetes bacterium]|nr:hypothetical protein [Bacteroidota bacterium]
MNSAQFHLLFTHLPIVGLGLAILVNLFALIRKSEELQKFSLWCYLVLGIFGLLAYITGDGAGEIMKTYPGITDDVIEPHENMALFFFIGLMITSAFSILALYLVKTRVHLLKRFNLYLLIAALLISILAVMTGSTGGAIRHTEIRQGMYKK